MGVFTGSWNVCNTVVVPIIAKINSLSGTKATLSRAGWPSTTWDEAKTAADKAQLKYCVIWHCEKKVEVTTWK